MAGKAEPDALRDSRSTLPAAVIVRGTRTVLAYNRPRVIILLGYDRTRDGRAATRLTRVHTPCHFNTSSARSILSAPSRTHAR